MHFPPTCISKRVVFFSRPITAALAAHSTVQRRTYAYIESSTCNNLTATASFGTSKLPIACRCNHIAKILFMVTQTARLFSGRSVGHAIFAGNQTPSARGTGSYHLFFFAFEHITKLHFFFGSSCYMYTYIYILFKYRKL